jgi:intracellular septation protein
MQKQSPFFFFSFLPALIYWYLEANYSLKIALIGGTILSLVEITLEKIFTKKVHQLSLFNFYLIIIFGGLAYFFTDGILFKLQPSFMLMITGIYLVIMNKKNKSLMLEMVEMNPSFNPMMKPIILKMEKSLSYFSILQGIFIGIVAYVGTTAQWLFWKTIGIYLLSGGFLIGFMIWIKIKSKP